jgi:bacterioferritin
MSALEKYLSFGAPIEEASAYFISIKTAAKKVAPPDETGELEGRFALPVEKVLAIMAELVRNEFESIYAYNVYAQSLRDLTHGSIADHFDEHSDDELEHANFLMRRMAVLGGPVNVPDLQAPPASSNPVEIVRTMIRMEQEGIAGWKKLLAAVGENPMRIVVEDYMAKEQEHLDDLWQLLPHEANRPVLQEKMSADETQQPSLEEMAQYDPAAKQMLGQQLLHQRNMNAAGAIGGGGYGGMGGALGGAYLASKYAPTHGMMGTAIGAGVGTALGVAPGLYGAYKKQREYEALNNPEMKMAAARMRKAAGVKVAFDGDPGAWIAQEQAMQQAQEQSESEYFKGLSQQASEQVQQKDQELQGLQQQLQAIQQQQQQMQQELDQSGQLQRQALDQARMVEQQASTTAAAAHQTATAATIQAMQSSQEVLRHKGMTAQMQQNVQAWKDQLMGIAQSDPTAGAGEQVGMPAAGPIQPAPQPQIPTQGGEVMAGPAGEAAGAEAPAGSPPPDGAGPQPQAATTSPAPEESMAPTAKSASARVEALSKVAADWKTRAVGGALGAAAGGGLGYAASRYDTSKLDPGIDKLRGRKESGEGGFVNAMQLAAREFEKSVLDAAHEHPGAAAAVGAVHGGMMGAGAAPTVMHGLGNMRGAAETLNRTFNRG